MIINNGQNTKRKIKRVTETKKVYNCKITLLTWEY